MGSDLLEQLESDVQLALAHDSPLQEWRRRGWETFLALKPSIEKRIMPRMAFVPEKEEQTVAAHSLLFVDGFLQSHAVPKKVVVSLLDRAMQKYGLFLQNWLSRSLKVEKNPWAALNVALHGTGAFLYIPPHMRIEEPIEICQCFTSSQLACSNLQVVLGQGASLSLIQRPSFRHQHPCANLRMDVSLDQGASLFLGLDGEWPIDAVCMEAYRFSLKKESHLHLLTKANHSKETNTSFDVRCSQERASALIQGFAHLDHNRCWKVQSTMEHLAPLCRSRQHFKTILDGESRFSFGGKIYIHPSAQKTESYQLSNHLLLSDQAKGIAEPNLEIFADDVKASHGATFTSLSDEELFYLSSRGIEIGEARRMLIQGFGDEILTSAPPYFRGR